MKKRFLSVAFHVSLWMVLEEPLAYGLNINKGMQDRKSVV